MTRLAGIFAVLCSCALAAGCGGGGAAPRTAPPVRVTVEGPSDQVTTLANTVAVHGTVSPAGATVLVDGRPATVSQGSFSAQVNLAPGTNVIDVLAGAPRAIGAMTAVRVYRELPVAVPDLSGASPSAASAELIRRGLRAHVVDVGGFFQSLIPSSSQVCRTSPTAGRSLAPGTTVEVQVAKLC